MEASWFSEKPFPEVIDQKCLMESKQAHKFVAFSEYLKETEFLYFFLKMSCNETHFYV